MEQAKKKVEAEMKDLKRDIEELEMAINKVCILINLSLIINRGQFYDRDLQFHE
jgi:hypothetical protein